MGKTSIEWSDRTWNPVRGCSRVSAGCVNCYAERQAVRFAGDGGPFQGFAKRVNGHPAWTGKVELVEKHLNDPLHWKKPQRVFVNSMSDLFHEALPVRAIEQIFGVMQACPQHQFQILTKRASNMVEILTSRRWILPALPNVWLGVSVEDQQTADERIPPLLQTPTAVRFVSYEPALGTVDFGKWIARLDWIIVGGESGPGARPCDIAWARDTVRQCKRAAVPCFVKQLGGCPFEEVPYGVEAGWEFPLKDRKGGDPMEWPFDIRVREFPTPRSAPTEASR